MHGPLATDDGNHARLHNLDAIRGIAAFIVLIHHCLLVRPAFSEYFFTDWRTEASTSVQYAFFYTPLRLLWAGSEAVILFYVLSGFVIALPWIEKRPPGYAEFCIKRIFRIYLPYLVIVALAAVPNLLLQPVFHVPGGSAWINTEAWSEPVTLGNLAQHVLMFGPVHFRINGAVHSLVWEMWVSLLFPLLIVPVVRWRGRGALGLLFCLFGMTAALQVLYAWLGAAKQPVDLATFFIWHFQRVFYYSIFFVIGAVIAQYRGLIEKKLRETSSYYTGAMCLAIGLMLMQARWAETHAVHNLYVALGSAFVIAASFAGGAIRHVLAHNVFQFLGRISFGLYLTHVPFIFLYAIFLNDIAPLWTNLIVLPPICLYAGWLYQRVVIDRCVDLGRRLAQALRHADADTLQPSRIAVTKGAFPVEAGGQALPAPSVMMPDR